MVRRVPVRAAGGILIDLRSSNGRLVGTNTDPRSRAREGQRHSQRKTFQKDRASRAQVPHVAGMGVSRRIAQREEHAHLGLAGLELHPTDKGGTLPLVRREQFAAHRQHHRQRAAVFQFRPSRVDILPHGPRTVLQYHAAACLLIHELHVADEHRIEQTEPRRVDAKLGNSRIDLGNRVVQAVAQPADSAVGRLGTSR